MSTNEAICPIITVTDLDPSDLPEVYHASGTAGEPWSVHVARGPGGWWAVVYEEAHDRDITWYASETEATAEAVEIADLMRR